MKLLAGHDPAVPGLAVDDHRHVSTGTGGGGDEVHPPALVILRPVNPVKFVLVSRVDLPIDRRDGDGDGSSLIGQQ